MECGKADTDDELSPELIWSLRALAQEARIQRELYPKFVLVTDELVQDFEDAFGNCSQDFRDRNPDLVALDRLIETKSGVLEYWVEDALEQKDFWSQLRRHASDALASRGLTTFAPHPTTATYISEEGVHDPAGRLKDLKNSRPLSRFSRLVQSLLRR